MNKTIVLDFEANFDSFKKRMQSAYEEVSKFNERYLGKDTTNTSSMSEIQRQRHEEQRSKQAREKFESKFSSQERADFKSGNANPFSQKFQDFKQGEKQFSDNSQRLKENSEAINKQNQENNSRHREYRSLTEKQLREVQEQYKKKAIQAKNVGDYESADRYNEERVRAKSAEDWHKQVEGTYKTPEERFQRQFAQNLFAGKVLGSAAEAMGGGGASDALHIAQGGMNTFAAARASGMSKGASAGMGVFDMIATTLLKGVTSGEKLGETVNQLSGALGKGNMLKSLDSFTGAKSMGVGIAGVDELEKALNEMVEMSGRTRTGYDITERFLDEKVLQKTMGIGKDNTFDSYVTGEKSFTGKEQMDSLSGTYMFAKMLEKLETGITLGDDRGVGKDLSQLPKYMSKLTSMQEKTLNIKGEVSSADSMNNMKFMNSVMGLGGIFKDSDNAGDLVSGMQQSFSNASDPLHKFKNVRAARQVLGQNASSTQVAMQMEDMSNPQGVQIINQFIKNLKQEYGGYADTDAGQLSILRDVQGAFNISSLSKSKQLLDAYDANGGLKVGDVSEMDQYSKDTKGFKHAVEKQLVSSLDGLKSELGGFGKMLSESMTDLAKGLGELTGALGEVKSVGITVEPKH
jgi:hypothetical protein